MADNTVDVDGSGETLEPPPLNPDILEALDLEQVDLARFLSSLDDNPQLTAARATLAANRRGISAARNIVGASANVGYGITDFNEDNPPDSLPPGASVDELDNDSIQAEASVRVSPFEFGDTADAVGRSRLDARAKRI